MPYDYACPYCGRSNVTTSPGNSCGRPGCNKMWRKEHRGARIRRLIESSNPNVNVKVECQII